jgi:hypothetical protein
MIAVLRRGAPVSSVVDLNQACPAGSRPLRSTLRDRALLRCCLAVSAHHAERRTHMWASTQITSWQLGARWQSIDCDKSHPHVVTRKKSRVSRVATVFGRNSQIAKIASIYSEHGIPSIKSSATMSFVNGRIQQMHQAWLVQGTDPSLVLVLARRGALLGIGGETVAMVGSLAKECSERKDGKHHAEDEIVV